MSFASKMLSIIFKMPHDQIIKQSLTREQFHQLIQGGRLIDRILNILNTEIRQERNEKKIAQ
jgi:hypothetical protein